MHIIAHTLYMYIYIYQYVNTAQKHLVMNLSATLKKHTGLKPWHLHHCQVDMAP